MRHRPRILFVDDEPRILSGIRRALHKWATVWDMVFAPGPEDALKIFNADPFDVVVSDLAMPNMNGVSMIMQMRKLGASSKFIMLTGTADLSNAVDAINRAEVFRFYTKPCSHSLLAEGITEALHDIGKRKQDSEATKSERTDNARFAGIGIAALNRLSVGAIVVDSSGRVLLTNQAGGRILAQNDGVEMSRGQICRLSNASATEQLLSLIKKVTADEKVEWSDDFAVSIERPSLKRHYSAFVTSIDVPAEQASRKQGKLGVIFISDPELHPTPSAKIIGKLFQLSPAESRLAHALASGMRLEEAADKCGITESTSRTYLKQIFSKTGTTRQSELIKLILTSPALELAQKT